MAMKKKTANKMTADRAESSKSQALGKLGRYLSARGTGGSADTMASRSSQRTRNLQNAVASSRGGGQGKASPMQKKITGSMANKKVATKSVAPKRTANKKPSFGSKKSFK